MSVRVVNDLSVDKLMKTIMSALSDGHRMLSPWKPGVPCGCPLFLEARFSYSSTQAAMEKGGSRKFAWS